MWPVVPRPTVSNVGVDAFADLLWLVCRREVAASHETKLLNQDPGVVCNYVKIFACSRFGKCRLYEALP
jgi:hypothetical protein